MWGGFSMKKQINKLPFISVMFFVLSVSCINSSVDLIESPSSEFELYENSDMPWVTEEMEESYNKPSQCENFIPPPTNSDDVSIALSPSQKTNPDVPFTSDSSLIETISPLPQTLESKTRYSIMQLLQLVGNNISEVIDVFGELPELASPYTGVYVWDEVYIYVDIDTLSTIKMISLPSDICEFDGVSLDRNRDELINIFGIPISEWRDEEGGPYYYGLILDFEMQTLFVRFVLRSSDEKSELIKIYPLKPPQHYWKG
jgi:hypothetical protein